MIVPFLIRLLKCFGCLIRCFCLPLTRFIDTYGTHIIVGVKMGGKDVIYAKQQHSSKLQPDDLQKRLKEVADKRFVEASGVQNIASDRIHPTSKVCVAVSYHHQNFLI